MKDIGLTKREANYLLWGLQLLIGYLFKQTNKLRGEELKKINKKITDVNKLKRKFI